MFSSVLYLLLLGMLVSFQEPAEGAPEGSGTRRLTPEEEEADMKEAFKMFDEDGDGEIDAAELKKLLTKISALQGPDEYVQNMISAVDADKSGTINYEEFCQMMNKPGNEKYNKAHGMFNMLDHNNDGYVTPQEMKNSGMFDEEAVDFAMKEADKNNDGRLDLDEFRVLLDQIDRVPKN